jgi:hypothetical protein
VDRKPVKKEKKELTYAQAWAMYAVAALGIIIGIISGIENFTLGFFLDAGLLLAALIYIMRK